MGTMSFSSIYGGRGGSTQEQRNVGGTAKVPTRMEGNVPILSGVATWAGVSLWVLIALGVMAFFLIEAFD